MSDLKAQIQGIRDAFNQALGQVEGLKNLEELRPELGQAVNRLKQAVETALTEKLKMLKSGGSADVSERKIDLTLPGVSPDLGSLHPLNVVNRDLIRIFERMGYEVAGASEVETDFYNFEALGLTKDHPARDMQDTFYITEEVVLRTHTSNVQVHLMQNRKPPFKAIMPGRVYRKDADITHSPMFNQVEGLVVGENITFTDLKGTLEHFLQKLFGPDTKMRLRPSFFPFTEPSAEVDVSCIMCGGKGCRVCKNSGWLEILGAGMVDPVVFRNVGYDPEIVSGFAFGLGVERVAMLKYGISDIRMFFDNDLRFLSQFN